MKETTPPPQKEKKSLTRIVKTCHKITVDLGDAVVRLLKDWSLDWERQTKRWGQILFVQ